MTDLGEVTFSIDEVHRLESSQDYDDWARGIQQLFVFAGLGDVTYRPINEPLATEIDAKTKWDRDQDVAKAAISVTIYYRALILFEDTDLAKDQLAKLKEFYRPKSIAVYSDLCRQLGNMTLADYTSVTEYAEAFQKVNYEMKRLGALAALPDLFLIQRFLIGLGDAYETFHFTFNQSRTFSFEATATTNPTLTETIHLALTEETHRSLRLSACHSQAQRRPWMPAGKYCRKRRRRTREIIP